MDILTDIDEALAERDLALGSPWPNRVPSLDEVIECLFGDPDPAARLGNGQDAYDPFRAARFECSVHEDCLPECEDLDVRCFPQWLLLGSDKVVTFASYSVNYTMQQYRNGGPVPSRITSMWQAEDAYLAQRIAEDLGLFRARWST